MPPRTQTFPKERTASGAQGVVASGRLDPLTGQTLPPKGKKFGNQPCSDLEGNKYHSLGERSIHLKFKAAYERGDCSEPRREGYEFKHRNAAGDLVKIGSYTSDIEVTAYRDFYIDTPADRYHFLAGQAYTIDVKSPATATQVTELRRRLMLAFHCIDVKLVYTKKPPRPKAKATKPGARPRRK